MKLAVMGRVPENPPLQPMPEFVKPNISGNINYNADEQAAKELERLNQGEGIEQQQQETEEQVQTPQNLPQEYPRDYTGLLIGILLTAVVVLLAGWWWFARRLHKRSKEGV